MAYKHKSGAQKRKERAARELAAKPQVIPPSPPVVNNSWGGNWNYSTAGTTLWDPNGPPIELPIYGQPPPNFIPALLAIITQLEQGSFYQSAYLWDGMTRDDRIAATMGQRIDRLVASPLDLNPSDPDEEGAGDELGASQQVALDAKKVIDKMMPMPQVYNLSRTALGLGVGLAQVLTTRTVKSALPTMKVWNMRYVRFDWTIRKLLLITENRGEIILDEEDPEWIIYQPFGPYGWLHGALIRSLIQPWIVRYWTRTWWSRYQEVHGQPLRLGIIPPDRKPGDEATFLKQLANLAHEAVIRMPQGEEGNRFDVKLLEASTNNWQGFMRLLEHCDDSIAISILGQRQSTMGQGGLKAQDDAGESTLTRITRKDALIATPLRDRLLKPWAKDNYGDEELAPIIEWQYEAPEDEGNAAKTDLAVAQALVQFKAASAPLDVRAYLLERGYPLLTEEEEAAKKAEAVKEAQQAMQTMTPDPEDPNPGSPQKGLPNKAQEQDASQGSESQA